MLTPSTYKLVILESSYVDVTNGPTPLTKDLPCDAVIISGWNVEDDTSDTPITRDATTAYDESGDEIYWGKGGVCNHQVFPTETTYYIGVNNAHDVSVRASANKSGGIKRVFWTAFKYVKIER